VETPIEALVDRLTESKQPATPDRASLAIQLYHTDLPKLADVGVVAYDPDRGTVQYQPDAQVEVVLDSLPDEVVTANS
jgi:hypothetical protein